MLFRSLRPLHWGGIEAGQQLAAPHPLALLHQQLADARVAAATGGGGGQGTDVSVGLEAAQGGYPFLARRLAPLRRGGGSLDTAAGGAPQLGIGQKPPGDGKADQADTEGSGGSSNNRPSM